MPRCRTGVIVRLASFGTALTAVLSGGPLLAEETAMQHALRDELPKFDAPRTSPIAVSEIAAVNSPRVKPRPSLKKSAPVVRLSPEHGIVLPEVAISVAPLKSTATPLPRSDPPAVQEEIKIDSFATAAYRDEQLMKRHLSAFDRLVMNRVKIPLIGESNVERAHNADMIYQSALSLGVIADQIELPKSPEANAAEEKKTKEMYYQLYYSRPR